MSRLWRKDLWPMCHYSGKLSRRFPVKWIQKSVLGWKACVKVASTYGAKIHTYRSSGVYFTNKTSVVVSALGMYCFANWLQPERALPTIHQVILGILDGCGNPLCRRSAEATTLTILRFIVNHNAENNLVNRWITQSMVRQCLARL